MSRTQLTAPVLNAILAAPPPEETSQPDEISLLQHLAALDRRLLTNLLEEEDYLAGEVIFQEGESGETAYLIWSGQIGVLKGDLRAPILLGLRGPGEVVGEMALLEGQPRSATIVALQDSRLLKINRHGFHTILQRAPVVGLEMLKMLSRRLRASDQHRLSEIQAERQLSHRLRELESERETLFAQHQRQRQLTELIVHDLRSPLTSLLGVINMLEVVLPEEVLQANRDLLNIGRSANLRLQNMIDSLLDIARLESGDQLQLSAVNLADLIKQALERARITPLAANLSLQADLPENLPFVQGDELRLERLLTNLVDNALKFTPKGGQITVAARQEAGHVLVSVTDSGPGVPPEERQRIFERFTQLEGGPARRRGFGLGLAYCKLTVEAHGGRIWVEEGEGGKGSRFCFTLPL